jgi:glycosyltransferase involved in cell wall biosynthesis
MRIMMVSQFYPPVLGGLERHVKDLSESLVDRGHQVSVVTLRQGWWREVMPEYEERNGVRIHRLRSTVSRAQNLLFIDVRRSYAPPFPDPECTFALKRILKIEQPQIVHAHNWLSFSYLPLKRWSGAKMVVTLHEFGLVCGKWTYLHKDGFCSGPQVIKCWQCLAAYYGLIKGSVTLAGQSLMRQIQNRNIDMYLPVSQAVADGCLLPESGLPFEVVPNFIPDDFAPYTGGAGNELEQLPANPFMLFVGSFSRQKGMDVLLEAYRRLDTTVPLVLIGYELSDFPLDRLNVPVNVHIFKNLPNPAVLEAWRRSMFGLVPSNWPEPSPTVVMEAMSMGKPVIASRVGGIPDILDESTGILVAPGDAEALRIAMHTLLRNPELCARMGKSARLRVATFQAKHVVARIEGIYEKLVYQIPLTMPLP